MKTKKRRVMVVFAATGILTSVLITGTAWADNDIGSEGTSMPERFYSTDAGSTRDYHHGGGTGTKAAKKAVKSSEKSTPRQLTTPRSVRKQENVSKTLVARNSKSSARLQTVKPRNQVNGSLPVNEDYFVSSFDVEHGDIRGLVVPNPGG